MSKASWKKWPEVQHGLTVENENLSFPVFAHIRTYTEKENGDPVSHKFKMEIGPEHLKESVLEELKENLRLVVEECTPKK